MIDDAYYAALELVARIDEGVTLGTHHYRTKAGALLTTLDEVVRAILENNLMEPTNENHNISGYPAHISQPIDIHLAGVAGIETRSPNGGTPPADHPASGGTDRGIGGGTREAAPGSDKAVSVAGRGLVCDGYDSGLGE